ncbi:MAG TPA: FUSC family protein [Baekduia sp.]|uniref:FUSC family protein n=1 Tax=Baekduia sp. TaxID=2600305 RepID=UPI002D767C0C|nr:FUSC family protein [Baekduia sp.]HET6507309.1 FUSC family protein [Baekduia sp.]
MSLGALRDTVRRAARDAWGFRARSLRATACILLPLAVLCAAGHPRDGVIATQGAFAGFYAFDAPYRRRARVVAAMGLALAVAMLLGTLVAPHDWLAVLVGAVFAALCAAGCLVLRVGPPREYFVVFTFLIAAALPPDPGAAPARAGLVLLGAATAWLISMAGTLRDARAPERTAVAAALTAVARLLDAVGRERAPAARHHAVLAVQRAQEAVADAVPPARPGTPGGEELARRAEAAEVLLEAALALLVERSPPLDPAWGRAVDALAEGAWSAPVIPRARPPVPAAARLDTALRAAGGAGWLDHREVREEAGALRVPRWRAALADLADPRSPAPAAALRLGLAIAVAGAAGYLLRAEHPSWIPLSAAAVLQGTNIALLRQRAVHRAVGTAIGVVLAAAVTSFDPGLAALVILVGVFQALTESLVLVVYGAAVVCITTLALLLLEIAGVGSVSGLLDARLVDTALGCAIGVAVGLLVWPRRSRVRLANVQAQAIRAAAAAVRATLGGEGLPERERRARRRDVHVAVVALDAAQRDATGDALAASARTDLRWPVTHAIEQLALVALALPRPGERPPPSREDARCLDALLADLAERVEAGRGGAVPAPPALDGWPRTRRAVAALCDALMLSS